MNVAAVRAAMRPTPAAAPANNVVPLRAVPQEAPAPPGAPSADHPTPRLTSQRWTRYAGTLGAGLAVTFCAASIRNGGNEPNPPEDSDVDGLRDALDEMLRLRFGDGAAPWWLEAALAAGGVYASMRINAKPIRPALVPDGQATQVDIAPPPAHRPPAPSGINLPTPPPPVAFTSGPGNGS